MNDQYYVAMRPSYERIALYVWIAQLEGAQNTDRPAILERVLQYADSLSEEKDEMGESEFHKRMMIASKSNVPSSIEVGEIPTLLKIRTEKELFEHIKAKFGRALNLKIVQIPYMIKTLGIAYALYLIEENKKLGINVGESENSNIYKPIKRLGENDELSDMESINILTAMYLSNRKYEKEIKAILKTWSQEHQEHADKSEYDVDPDMILKNGSLEGKEQYIDIEVVIDDAYMCQWTLDSLKKERSGYYLYDPNKTHEEESISVRFEVAHSYQVFEAFSWYWGGFNNCPESGTMRDKAKEWYEEYHAELVKISHDSLTFRCRELSEDEAKEIIEAASALHAEIIDCDAEKLIAYIMENRRFTLWWD